MSTRCRKCGVQGTLDGEGYCPQHSRIDQEPDEFGERCKTCKVQWFADELNVDRECPDCIHKRAGAHYIRIDQEPDCEHEWCRYADGIYKCHRCGEPYNERVR